MLRDRLVVGCREAAIQRKLLSDTSLTFEKAVTIATAMEMASRDVEKIKEISQPESQSASSQEKKCSPSGGRRRSLLVNRQVPVKTNASLKGMLNQPVEAIPSKSVGVVVQPMIHVRSKRSVAEWVIL